LTLVGVTQVGRLDLQQNLARFRAFKFHFHNFQ
jgi:hypothetical protein